MTIKPIKTERDHQKALKEIEKLSKVSGFALLIFLPEGPGPGESGRRRMSIRPYGWYRGSFRRHAPIMPFVSW
jgi:hypothetical protein